jgi:hypothetical protein
MKNLEIGATYKHYKHKDHKYEIVGIAFNSETLEEMVVYKALYESEEYSKNALWVRPKEMFLENVIVDGVEVERFKKVDGEILIRPRK